MRIALVALAPVLFAAGCAGAPVDSPPSGVQPSPVSTPVSSRSLTDTAAAEIIAGLNALPLGLTCELTGDSRDAGRDRGYFLSSPRSVSVSTTTFRETVRLEPMSRGPWDPDGVMTVVVPSELRGRELSFEATYDGIEVLNRTGPHPDGYGGPSRWPVVLSQLVSKTDYDITCTNPQGRRTFSHTIGVWDGLRLAVYPDGGEAPVIIKETPLP